jgi:pimeloyl-ACP methyl ester carboxylesterase
MHDTDTAQPGMPEPPPMPEPTVVASGGVDLAVYDFGGDGDPVLLVHANGFCAAVWAPVAARLSDHRCVAFDLRAHGRSRPHDGDLSWDRHGEDVLAVVDALELGGALGVGHSMGGAALLLAEQARPGTFASLWVWEPIVFPPVELPAEGNTLAAGALRRRASFPSEQAAYDNFAGKPPLDELAPLALAAYVHYGFQAAPDGGIELRCIPQDESELYRQGPRHRAWEHLDEVSCAVTVLRSEPTGAGADLIAPMIAERIPRARLEDHPELGHFGPLADFDAVAASIRAAERSAT